MYLDTLTISGLALALVIIVGFFILLLSHNKANRERFLQLEEQLAEAPSQSLIPSEDARHLCCAIRRIYPSANVGLDFHVGDDGDGPYIREWMTPLPKPSEHHMSLLHVQKKYHLYKVVKQYLETYECLFPGKGDVWRAA